MRNEIDNSQDILDGRDVSKRVEELQEEREALQEEIDNLQEEIDSLQEGDEAKDLLEKLDEAKTELTNWDEENGDEYKAIKAFADECEENSSDFSHGETIIRESYWTEYVQEMLEDCGDLPKNLPSYIEIDWTKTARNIKADYSEVDFDGVCYLIRNS